MNNKMLVGVGIAAGVLGAALIPMAIAYAVPAPDPFDDLQEIAMADQNTIQEGVISFDNSILTGALTLETEDINAGFNALGAGNVGGALAEFDAANLEAFNAAAAVNDENTIVLGALAANFPLEFFNAFQPG